MSRSVWKLPYYDRTTLRYASICQSVAHIIEKRVKPPIWHSWSRSSTISKWLVQYPVQLHNGQEQLNIVIQKFHVGFKFGSLLLTKTIGSFVHKHNRLILKKKKAAAILKQRKVNRKSGKVKKMKSKKKKFSKV